MTHTPGPWKVEKGYGSVWSDGSNAKLICDFIKVLKYPISRCDVPANAALIAAAPAMLEALKGCERVTKAWLADMKDYPLVNPEKAAATMELIRIQEAIRLAEGRGEL